MVNVILPSSPHKRYVSLEVSTVDARNCKLKVQVYGLQLPRSAVFFLLFTNLRLWQWISL